MKKRINLDLKNRKFFLSRELEARVLKCCIRQAALSFAFTSDNNYHQRLLKNFFLQKDSSYNNTSLLSYTYSSNDSLENYYFLEDWKNKSYKIIQKRLKFSKKSKIRNFCVLTGRGRGLSKKYFSLSRNAFKHFQALGFLSGVYKA